MQRPPQIDAKSLRDYVEMMSRAIFSAGLSWRVIEAKWPGSVKAFDEFDPQKVAAYTPDDIERLMADPGVIHNRKKIEAIVGNAGEMIVVDREFGGFRKYLESFDTTQQLAADLHKRFKFMGEFATRYFLFAVRYREDEQEAWAMAQAEKMHT